MKMKRIWKKVIVRVLTTAMLVSVFSIVDMGWNVIEVRAESYSIGGQVYIGTKLNQGDILHTRDYNGHAGGKAVIKIAGGSNINWNIVVRVLYLI